MRPPFALTVALALVVVPLALAAPQPPATLAGEGALLGVGCSATYRLAFEGADVNERWVIHATFAPETYPAGCPARTPAATYYGPWDPAPGGCFADSPGTQKLCLNARAGGLVSRYDATIVDANVVTLRGVVQVVVADASP